MALPDKVLLWFWEGAGLINTLILDVNKARNLVTSHSHGFLTQDGKHPSEIQKMATEQLSKYPSVSYRQEEAIDAKIKQDGFVIYTTKGSYQAKRLILATGYKDRIEELGIEGLTEVYGKSVYPCPFCDGFELADKPLAVFSQASKVLSYAKTISHWSDDIVVFTNGDTVTDSEVISSLRRNKIELVQHKIRKLISQEGRLTAVLLENNATIEREAGFIADTKSIESTDLAKRLKVPADAESGQLVYKVDHDQESEIKGLFIVGDAINGWSGVAKSVAEGSTAGRAITLQLVDENWR